MLKHCSSKEGQQVAFEREFAVRKLPALGRATTNDDQVEAVNVWYTF
jgi:hypothetical protein